MTTTTAPARRRWTEDDFDRILAFRRKGLTIARIAGKFGVAKTTIEEHIKRRKRRDPAWAATYAAAYLSPCPAVSSRENAPPAPSAAAVRFEARAAELLAACAHLADECRTIRGTLPIVRYLGWADHSVRNMIHGLRIKDRFPYTITRVGRGGSERPEEDDDAVMHAGIHSRAEITRAAKIGDNPALGNLPARTPPIPGFHGPTPTPEGVEETRVRTIRENVKRYIREHKSSKRRSAYVVTEADAERCRKLAENREKMRLQSLSQRRKRKVA